MINVDLFLNELSLHGQFANLVEFRESIRRVMKIREISRRHQRSIYCHRRFASCHVTTSERMAAAVKALPLNEQRAVMAWLSHHGPFWDDDRQHDGGDWYEHGGEIVTDTSVGEAAYCRLHGIERGLISLQPSKFLHDPVRVKHLSESGERTLVDLRNFWEPDLIETFFTAAPPPLISWTALESLSTSRFENLRFSRNAFEPLRTQPFRQSIAERILARLATLQDMKECFNKEGTRTGEGHILYQQYFTGDKGWFSDSSPTEKKEFKQELTFPHPDIHGESLFCTWHGKVKSPQYRIHFSWPITALDPVYVVYIGPKITKR